MYFGFLVRNLYTSIMYSFITRFPDAKNVPNEISELFFEPHDILVISSITVANQFINDLEENRLKKLVINKTRIIINRLLLTGQLIQNLSNDKPVNCNSFNGNHKGTPRECLSSNRYAILYNTVPKTTTDLKYFRLLVPLFSRRRIVDNFNQLGHTQAPVFWNFKKSTLFGKHAERIIASFVECGLNNYVVKKSQISIQRLVLSYAEIVPVLSEKAKTFRGFVASLSDLNISPFDGNLFREAITDLIKFQDLWVIFLLLIFLFGISTLVFIIECTIFKTLLICGNKCNLMKNENIHKQENQRIL